MRFAKEGYPFIGAALALSMAFWILAVRLGSWWWTPALALTVVAAFVVYFFRDPERSGPSDPALILAPGDGRVVEIAEVEEPTFLGGRCRRISIFLSVFDVHVQRTPVAGRVGHRSYRAGGYAVAWHPKASEENEQASLGIETDRGGVLVRQIAGLVARRIVTYPREGDVLGRGDRIGIIRFGSRVDTFVPPEWTVTCRVGDTARAGRTTLARMAGGTVPAPDRAEAVEAAGAPAVTETAGTPTPAPEEAGTGASPTGGGAPEGGRPSGRTERRRPARPPAESSPGSERP